MKFRRLSPQILLSLALFLITDAALEAQAFGRVTMLVKDKEGKPLEGVSVVVTCDALPKFREELKTNKKGRAIASFTDATKVYNFHLEYADFQAQDVSVKPTIRSSTTREVTLTEGQIVRTGAGETVFTAAEKAFNEGVVALQSGDMATAKDRFLAALEKNEKMLLVHSALAGVYLEEENYQAALDSTQKFLESEPDNPRGVRMLYEAHSALGNKKEAEAALKALSNLDQGGDTVAMIYNEGVAAIKVGDYAGARVKFLKALEIDPDLKEAVGAMAIIHFQDGDFQKAAAMAERHLELDPGNNKSLRVRWDAYTKLGDTEKTAAAFTALADADPKVLITELYNTGNDLFENGDTPGAAASFEKVLEIDPDHPRAHYRLGVCHVGAGDNAAAKEHLQRFLELAPEDPEASVANDMLRYLN